MILNENLKGKKGGMVFEKDSWLLEHDKTVSLIHDLLLFQKSHSTLLEETTQSADQYDRDIL